MKLLENDAFFTVLAVAAPVGDGIAFVATYL